MLWDWECSWFQPEPGSPAGGGTVILGVAWFDTDFWTVVGWMGCPARRPGNSQRLWGLVAVSMLALFPAC